MIPSTVGFLDKDFEIEEQPSLTYKMQMDSIYGEGSCKDLRIRKYGGIKVM